jgi:hypothetical protein
MTVMTRIQILILRIACLFGIHEWHNNNGLDQYFYPQTTKKCFWCGKRS